MITGEGKIEITLEDFWEYLINEHIENLGECTVIFGKPKVNVENQTLEIEFAFDSEGDPDKWAVEPLAKKEWDEN